jgi:transcription-repair coupling factor (superfamily II helicase)
VAPVAVHEDGDLAEHPVFEFNGLIAIENFKMIPDAYKVTLSKKKFLHFKHTTSVDPIRLIELVQKQKNIRFAGQDKLRIELKGLDVNARYEAVRTLLRSLA